MDKKSLTKAKEIIIKALSESDIDLLDKLELVINLNALLDRENYDEGVKVLKLHQNKKKRL